MAEETEQPRRAWIEIDFVPQDELHVVVHGHSRDECLDAVLAQARRWYGDEVELAFTRATVRYVGAHVDTWEMSCWARPTVEPPITFRGENGE